MSGVPRAAPLIGRQRTEDKPTIGRPASVSRTPIAAPRPQPAPEVPEVATPTYGQRYVALQRKVRGWFCLSVGHGLAQRLHQAVRPGEHGDRVGEVEDVEVAQALRTQRRRVGRFDGGRIASELCRVIEDRAAARIDFRLHAVEPAGGRLLAGARP